MLPVTVKSALLRVQSTGNHQEPKLGAAMKSCSFRSLVVAVTMLFSASVQAGVYSDDLTRCIVEASTPVDRIVLMQWLFTAMAQHPAVKSIASVPESKHNSASQRAAKTFKQLLGTCKSQVENAVEYEGEHAIESSFEVLGKIAASGLFSHPDVAASIAKVAEYVGIEEAQTQTADKQYKHKQQPSGEK